VEEKKNGAEHCIFLGQCSALTVSGDGLLLNRTCGLRENTVGVGADHPYRAHNEHEDYSQHHSVFSNVLTLVI
jgi:hypothetical protein